MLDNRIYSDELAIAAQQNTKERDYWLNRLSGELVSSYFPYDFTTEENEPTLRAFKFSFSEQINSRLAKLVSGSDYRLHMTLLAGVVALLEKYTGRNDIIVGSPIYKQDIEGEFVNKVLALRNHIEESMTFKELILQVRETIGEAVENYGYPIEFLPGKLNIPYSGNENFPLFDVAVLLENIHDKKYIAHIKINMIFSFLRKEKTIEGIIEYNSLRYKKSTIERVISHLTRLMQEALANPDLWIESIDILSDTEKQQLLFHFNNTGKEYPQEKTIRQLFEEQVLRTPDHVAAAYSPERRTQSSTGRERCPMHCALTYRALNEKANQLAALLRKRGIAPDTIVVLMMDSSLEMIVCILGILKAGGAYLPVSPALPQERLISMLNDSNAAILLTKEEIIEQHSFEFTSFQGFASCQKSPYCTSSRTPVKDLDRLQIPDRSLIDYEKYRPYIGQAMVKNSITIHMSRGCVFNCAFCFKIWPRQYIIRSAENIFQEINLYYKMGIRRFAFVDDLPNINVEISSKVFRLIIENGLKVHLHFPNGIRGDILTKEYIDLMVAAGTITMDLALETSSPRLQKLIRKNLNLKKLKENIQYITGKYPHVILELQILHGIPTETEDEARASLDFIKSIRWIHFPYIHILNIYPGSDMARIAERHGISKDAIERSADLAYHEIPDTSPFSKSFTRKYQAEFLNEYFLAKERLMKVLPFQMQVLTEDELVQKYDSYLPVKINRFSDLLDYVGISENELKGRFLPADYGEAADFNHRLAAHFVPLRERPSQNALRILLLDLSQYFTQDSKIMYDVVEPPLGLLYLLTHLNRTLGKRINGKIARSRIDFDSYEKLRDIIRDFKPDIIGVRTLNFYKDFFHKTLSLIRQWGIDVPIVAGGPYATSSWATMLKDKNIDLAVIGEGEITFNELIGEVLKNNGKLPGEEKLRRIPGIAFVQEDDHYLQTSVNRDILLLDRLDQDLSRQPVKNPLSVNSPGNLAYIIYTSGSTGTPKGVMIQHNNLVNQVVGLIRRFDLFDAVYNYILLAAFTFDVSVMHIFLSLSTGSRLFLISEETKRDSVRLWQFIYENKIDVLNIVPSFMKALLESIKKKRFRFKYLFVGGDVFDKELYNRLKETFSVGMMINIYGPTETTINAALYQCVDSELENLETIPIGKPLMNYKAYILDKDLKPLPIGVKGELYISGAGVARGYLNRPDLTAEKFKRAVISHSSLVISSSKKLSPNDQCPMTNDHLYKTGDLARWLPDGNIEFSGRIDQQVKVRGFRIEPGEIEKQLLSHEKIKEAVVLAREDGEGEKYLCAYLVTGAKPTPKAELRDYLSRTLPEYMIPAHFVSISKIPLTPNGKVDRAALPEPTIMIGTEYTVPRDVIEEKLAELWSKVVGMEREKIGIDMNFFELGGHSLKATILIAKVQKEFNVKVPIVEFFKKPTVRGLSTYIKEAVKVKYDAVVFVEEKEYYQLSSAQRRLYFLQQLVPETTGYNLTVITILQGKMSIEKINRSLKKMIIRHESLRTSFRFINGEPVQIIHNPGTIRFKIEYFESDKSLHTNHIQIPENKLQSVKLLIEKFTRPFVLSQTPLLRVGLIKGGDDSHILMVDMHHIICDGISQELFFREFTAYYGGLELPESRIQYRHYSQWQIRRKKTPSLKQQEAYWLKRFAGGIPVLDLPTDNVRPKTQSFAGSAIGFEIGLKETAALKNLAAKEELTLYMLLLAVYFVFAARLSGQEDILIGTPTAGRVHDDLQGVIGMFVNTLALRNYPVGCKNFGQFLKEIKASTLQAFENQEYQYEDLVECLTPKLSRDPSRNPIFDIVFAWQNTAVTGDIPEIEIPGLKLRPYQQENKTAKFDLTFAGREAGERVFFAVEYCTDLFKKETIERFAGYFKTIASSLTTDTDRHIAEIDIIPEKEKERILFEFNDTEVDFPGDKTIHRLFEEQAAKTPPHTAVVGPGTWGKGKRPEAVHLTYRQLNRESDQLARILRSKGVSPEDIVALMPAPSIGMIVAMLGILKAGGAFLAVAPEYPPERLGFMLRDSQTKLLLTTRSRGESMYSPVVKRNEEGEKLRMWQGETIFLEEGEKLRSLEVETEFVEESGPGVGARRALPSGQERRGESMYSPDLPDQECRGESMYSPDLPDQESRGESMYSPEKAKSEIYQARRSALYALRSASSPENLAYVIYTSGSSGRPKGVMIEHRSLVNLCHWHNTHYSVTPSDRAAKFAGFGFDASMWEIFPYMIIGASIYIIEKEIKLQLDLLNNYFEKHKISITFLFPQILEQFLKFENRSLRLLLTGGDKLNYFKEKDYQLANNYGPTENTVVTTSFFVERYSRNIPIGKPIFNNQVYILDKNHRLQPLGAAGQLCISGQGLARGYLNNPELTGEKFINYKLQITNDKQITNNTLQITNKHGKAAPHHSSFITHHSALLYKTGDLARWLPDGNIEFLGRLDNQVKIRGYRIEPGEIECCLLKHEAVKEAVAAVREDKKGDKSLCAYLVTEHIAAGTKHIKEYLSQYLPDYMIPAYFVFLEEIPITANGKVDLNALPFPGDRIDTGVEYAAPGNEIEEELLKIWQDILGIEKIGVDDNLFDLGGTSITLLKMHAKMEQKYPTRTKVVDFFTHTTIAKLAKHIAESSEAAKPRLELPQLELPEDFFDKSQAAKGAEMLSFKVRGSMAQKLKDISSHRNIPLKVILLSIYIYLFREMTGKEKVSLQTIVESDNTIHSISIDLSTVESIPELFKLVERTLKDGEESKQFMIEEISQYPLSKDKKTIYTLFYLKNLLHFNGNLTDVYDIAFEVYSQGDYIELSFEYSSRIKREKIEEFTETYLKLLDVLIKSLRS